MHAHLKKAEGVNALMQFCPLDLFSGSKVRLECAIEGLWNSWIQSNGSINNLRIFSHGKIVLPSDVGPSYLPNDHTETDLGVGTNLASVVTRNPLFAR
jgi:Inositol-pentakisphosphate 2-kinase